MKAYTVDHDLHLHSRLSSCSNDPEQTPQRILAYAQRHRLHDICLTDHFWDETVEGASDWYIPQNFRHISQALPLPQQDGVRFHFGCETEMDRHMRLGISEETLEKLEFCIIPTTHLHMRGFTIDESDTAISRRRALYVERLEALLSMPLPFEKIGIAHLTCQLMAPDSFTDHIGLLDGIPDATFFDLFSEAARKGAGIELNFPLSRYQDAQRESILRPYRIAKACGCRFYLGSDAHHPASLTAACGNFEAIVSALSLTEADKFAPFGTAAKR